jgi:uncharacterized protein
MKITIQVGEDSFNATLTDEHSPRTVQGILDALPIEAVASTWGDEIYFGIPVDVAEENAAASVSVGDLAYWPAGSCFCIFYGRTPMSPSDDEILPASPVNLIGRIERPTDLKAHRTGETVTIRLAE